MALTDDATRMVRFEDMRLATRNKKLYCLHKELSKQCENEVRRYEHDTKVVTTDLKRQKLIIESKQEKLKEERKKCELERQKTRVLFDKMSRKHQVHGYYAHLKEEWCKQREPTDTELLRAVGKLVLPKSMRLRVQAVTAQDISSENGS